MIKYDDGTIEIHGSTIDTVLELSGLIRGINEALTERHGANTAKELIAFAGRVGFLDESEMTDKSAKEYAEMFCDIAKM